jgi:hypothetical protein
VERRRQRQMCIRDRDCSGKLRGIEKYFLLS